MKFSKNKKLLLIAVCAFIVMLLSTVSYAYFTASVNGNNTAQSTVITTGNMKLLLTDGAEVKLQNALPGSSVTKTFKVKNIGTVASKYDVYLSEIINTFEDKNDLVYTLTSTTGCPNITETVMPSVVGEQSKIISSCNINPNIEHEYTLTITFKEDNTNQDDNKGKRYSAKISINEYIEKEINIASQIVDLKTYGATDLEYDGVDTLGEYGTEDNNLRYVGANPNNYVYFNCTTTNPNEMNDETCEKWRIIGAFNNVEDENENSNMRVKILRDDLLNYDYYNKLGSYSWDTSDNTVNSGTGINQWGASEGYEGADLMRELNTDYLGNITVGNDGNWYNQEENKKESSMPTNTINATSQNMIQTVKWNTGAVSIATYDDNEDDRINQANIVYKDERSNDVERYCEYDEYCNDSVNRTNSWIGKIGLIHVSDYLYSTSGNQELSRTECFNKNNFDYWNRESDCGANTWMLAEEWYFTIDSSYNNNNIYLIRYDGYIDEIFPAYSVAVRPSLYLKNNVSIVSGNGSESNPYKLTM